MCRYKKNWDQVMFFVAFRNFVYGVTHPLEAGDRIQVGDHMKFEVSIDEHCFNVDGSLSEDAVAMRGSFCYSRSKKETIIEINEPAEIDELILKIQNKQD